MERPYIKIYLDFLPIAKEFNIEQLGRIFSAIIEHPNGAPPNYWTRAEKIAFLALQMMNKRDGSALSR